MTKLIKRDQVDRMLWEDIKQVLSIQSEIAFSKYNRINSDIDLGVSCTIRENLLYNNLERVLRKHLEDLELL